VVLVSAKEVKKMKVIGIFVILVFLCSSVFAISGVSPASYEVDFEPGYSGEFVFDFVVDEGAEDLYAEGDLAEYVSFDKKSVSGREKVVVSLNLPSEIDSPGVNYIRVVAGKAVGGIKVRVPYSEKYVEVGLNAPNANVGENVLFGLELFGRGNESVVVSPRIEVYKDGESVEIIDFESVEVASGDEVAIDFSLDTDGYSAGDYLAVAFADYNDMEVSAENPFRLGEFLVGLVNYTKSFRENKIDRFEILVESLWDDDMNDVYVEVNVLGFPSANFATSPEGLDAWGRRVFVGFLDMSKIDGDTFEAEIILYYGDETSSNIVELKVIEGFDYVFWVVILVFVAGLAFLVWRCVIFIERFKKHRVKGK